VFEVRNQVYYDTNLIISSANSTSHTETNKLVAHDELSDKTISPDGKPPHGYNRKLSLPPLFNDDLKLHRSTTSEETKEKFHKPKAETMSDLDTLNSSGSPPIIRKSSAHVTSSRESSRPRKGSSNLLQRRMTQKPNLITQRSDSDNSSPTKSAGKVSGGHFSAN